jgi:hypothetical protein
MDAVSLPEPGPDLTPANDRIDIPTLDRVLGAELGAPPLDAPEPAPARAPQAAASASPAGRSIVADAFAALLAVEQGEPGASPVRLTSSHGEPAITDAFIDEVTRRVVQRLAPDAIRQVVADVVSETAERMVRDEIDRIRGRK